MKTFVKALAGIATASSVLPMGVQASDLLINVTNTGAFQTNAGSSFSHPSTIQYNASQGQNNNFAVGANTSFGSSASASSTPDYAVTASSILQSSTVGTTLRNQIGTSGSAAASAQQATAAGSLANTLTKEAARENKYEVAGGWEYRYNGATYASEAAFEAAYTQTNTYKQQYETAYKAMTSSSSSATSSALGTISGTFESTSNGNSNLKGSSTSNQAETLYVRESSVDATSGATSWNYRAASADELRTGKTNGGVTISDYYTAAAGSSTSNSSTTNYTAATSAQVSAASSAAASAVSSQANTNKVVVSGIGSDATFAAAGTSVNNVGIASNLGQVNEAGANAAIAVSEVAGSSSSAPNTFANTGSALILLQGDGKISSSATANGSAGGSFGTNSTASSNSSTFTSVFYQAF